MSSLLTMLLLALSVLLRTCPDTPLASFLRRAIVERFCNWIAGLSRQDLIYVFILAGLMLSLGEMIATLGSADFVFAYALDLSFYADAVITGLGIAVASHSLRLPGRTKALLSGKTRLRLTQQRQRRKRIRKIKPPASINDDDGPALRCAA